MITPYLSSHGQSLACQTLVDHLTDEEHKIFRRGYNSQGAKKYGNDMEYRWATALEAVVGYLFLSRKYERVQELLEAVISVVSAR